MNELEGQLQSPLIVIVDDELLQRLPMRETLEQSSFRVLEASDGAEAWALIQQECPDLVISDVVMPRVDGFALCETVRRRVEFKHLPIVMATSLDDEASIERAYLSGATDFITKPINWDLLGHRVRYVLRGARIAQSLANRELELLQTRIEIIRRLGQAAEYRDNETGLHLQRMSHYSVLMGRGIGLSAPEQELLLHAAPMHDVGKIGISDNILLKPGKLTEEEFTIMKTHTILGAQLLDQEPSPLMQTAHTIALTHHERWDGQGYPYGLARNDIPIMGRICSLADVFDALTSKRPYKLPWSVDQAVHEINRNSGFMFDPAMVEVFHAVLPEILKIKEAFSDPVQQSELPS